MTPTIRFATPDDLPAIHRLIVGLAVYEKLEHLVVSTPESLHAALFGAERHVEVLLLSEKDGEAPVAFALFFHNYSTFLGRRGLYLEDLFVEPGHRGKGYGRALLARLAAIAVERDCGRFEWSVLDWNVDAQGFYEKLGAVVMPDWRITRMTGDALATLAAEGRS